MTREQALVILGALQVCEDEGVKPRCFSRNAGKDGLTDEQEEQAEREILLDIYRQWPELLDHYSDQHWIKRLEEEGKIQLQGPVV